MSGGVRMALLGALLFATGCASAPRPRVLGELDRTQASPRVVAARSEAPQATARAENLRHRAEEAHEKEDPSAAQILGEQALAAYQRAVILSSLAPADARATAAAAKLARVEAELRQTTEIQQKLEADTRAIELRLKVARETLPDPVSGPPQSPDRELARREAARALVAQARLLCTAARLLDAKRPSLEAAFTKLAELEARLPTAAFAPIDEARVSRAACLRELSSSRRAKIQANPASPAADKLLSELSDASLLPSRDDRGVVVTLQRPFEKDDQLSDEAAKRLAALALVAKSHPDFPLLVVVHSSAKLPEERENVRSVRAASALRQQGAPNVTGTSVGAALPGLDPKKPGAAGRNDRLEVVFVAPTAS
jgi:hypothetical protein